MVTRRRILTAGGAALAAGAVARRSKGGLITIAGGRSGGGTPSASGWRKISVSSTNNPFLGPPEQAYGGAKHVNLKWIPASLGLNLQDRVLSFGGDYNFASPGAGASFTTNEPGATTYPVTMVDSLRNDMQSIDPNAGSPQWRLEHPYLPRNMGGGVREQRPGRPDQVSLVVDTLRNKLWCLQNVIRTEFLLMDGSEADLWANGDMTASAPYQPIATYSFAPGVGGSPGTFAVETTKRLIYRTGATTYSGDTLLSGWGDERIGLFEHDPTNDVIACMSCDTNGLVVLFTFHPSQVASGTIQDVWQYRTRSLTSTYSYLSNSCTYVGIIDGWIYGVAMTRDAGTGTRKSKLMRINISAALGVANEGTIPADAIELFDLPWSLSPGAVWEDSNDGSAKWQEHCGVGAINDKIVLACSYDEIIDGGTTKAAIFDPATDTFTAIEAPSENFAANAWCVLPDTNELLMTHNTSGGDFSSSDMWAYALA